MNVHPVFIIRHFKDQRIWICLLFLEFFLYSGLVAREKLIPSARMDTLRVTAGSLVWIADRSFVVPHDTIMIIPTGAKYLVQKGIQARSSTFYDSLRARVDKNIVTRTLGDLVMVSSRQKLSAADTIDFQQSVKSFMPYSGKRILKIRFRQVEVLSGSVWDTTTVTGSALSNTLNAVHVKTRDQVIANNLLFQEGDSLRPSDLADTERILRALPSIEDARIYVFNGPAGTGSVNLLVITKDVFSWGLGFTFMSTDKYRLRITNRNLLGRGAELKYSILYNHDNQPPLAHDFRYTVYNISRTFISGTFNYINSQKQQVFRLFFNRPLISPQIKFIGNADLSFTRNLLDPGQPGESTRQFVRVQYQDLWIGRVFLLGKLEERKNLIFSTRISRTRFLEHPDLENAHTYFYNNTLLLGRISLAKINYFKSRMIYSFGRTEDVPYGILMQVTPGYEYGKYINRPYLGADFSWANSLDGLGYMGIATEFGTFMHNKKFEQGVLNLKLLFFSHLIDFNHFKIRQIVRLVYTNGINRAASQSINLKNKLQGFTESEPTGKRNLILGIETVTFTPWYFYGFRFALFAYADIALLSNQTLITSPGDFYSVIGFGCRIKNESLVFETLNLRLGYFIRAPEGLGPWSLEIQTDDPEISQGILGLKPVISPYR